MYFNGPKRSYMAKNKSAEDFLMYVAEEIETQLKEWDEAYEVLIMKMEHFEFNVKKNETYYEVHITENELDFLQKKDPFALDRKIWPALQDQGLPIKKGKGNYLDFVMSKFPF